MVRDPRVLGFRLKVPVPSVGHHTLMAIWVPLSPSLDIRAQHEDPARLDRGGETVAIGFQRDGLPGEDLSRPLPQLAVDDGDDRRDRGSDGTQGGERQWIETNA